MKAERLIAALICLTISIPTLSAQKKVREENWFGNRYFKWDRLTDAEVHYRKALEANPKDPTTLYNLSNLLYRTDRGEENGKLTETLYPMIKDLPDDKAADVAHNAGNSALRRKDYEHAVEFFKESLRRRPTDDETRYNLALAQKLLEKQKQDEQQQNQDQNKNQKQNRDKQQDKNQQQQQSPKDQDQNKKPDKPQDKPQQNQEKDRMSRQAAEQILKSFLQDEKQTQKKVEQAQQQKGGGGNKREKNW